MGFFVYNGTDFSFNKKCILVFFVILKKHLILKYEKIHFHLLFGDANTPDFTAATEN